MGGRAGRAANARRGAGRGRRPALPSSLSRPTHPITHPTHHPPQGGAVLSWIDICAGLAAKTLARGPAVTASVDAVHFLRPCHAGSVVILAAMVNRTFNSSMEVGVRVEEEDARTGARHHCCRWVRGWVGGGGWACRSCACVPPCGTRGMGI